MPLTHVGKYHLVSKLATGGMAEVFLAKVEGPMGFEKTLVLKRILPHLAEDPQFVGMFFTEARVAAQLNHPHIVQIFDFGQAEGAYYIAMEYIDGPDLRTLSGRAVQEKVALPPTFCAKIISAACEGLSFAHDFVDPASGKHLELIHRDISPDNILLSRQGAVKVVDFGIAKVSNQSHKTRTGLIKGKIAYMPPEQLQGQVLDRRVDVYALGVVLYELLTGHYPFEASTDVSMMQAILFEPLVPASKRRTDLPEALVGILDKALAKVREQRYPDCVALQADLDRFIVSTGEPMSARDLALGVARYCPKPAESVKIASIMGQGLGFASTAVSETPAPQPSGFSTAPTDPGKTSRPALQTSRTDPVPAVPDVPQGPGNASRSRRLGMAVVGLTLAVAGSGFVLTRGTLSSGQGTGDTRPPPPVVATVPPPTPPGVAALPPPPPPTTPPWVAPPGVSTHVETPPVEPAPTPRRAQKSKLTFRIRPYATVFLDDKVLGQTPIPAVMVTSGAHKVRLVNREYDQDITRTIEVKAGQPFTFTHTLDTK